MISLLFGYLRSEPIPQVPYMPEQNGAIDLVGYEAHAQIEQPFNVFLGLGHEAARVLACMPYPVGPVADSRHDFRMAWFPRVTQGLGKVVGAEIYDVNAFQGGNFLHVA